MSDRGRRRIAENRAAHDRLGAAYEARHPEIFNPVEQERLAVAVARAVATIATTTAPNERVMLDVGAGTGNLTAHLLAHPGSVVAADLSAGMLEVIARRHEATGRVRTQLTEGDDLHSLPDASADLVAAYSVLHHVPDYVTLVRDMARVVRPGGVVYIEHEKAPAYWAGGETLGRFFREAVVRPPQHWTRFVDPATYWRRLRPLLAWRRWMDPRWMPEGDLHIWPDDHIEWEAVSEALRAAGCPTHACEDHLAYEPRFDRATWERWRDRVVDTRFLIARRAT